MRKLLLLTTALILGLSVWAQRQVKGRVTDSKGSPIAGANITVRGQNTGTQSAADGSFSISAAEGATLIISNVGFSTNEVKVSGNDLINVQLEVQASELTTVMVTAVGIKREAKTIGYAASTIKNEELTRGRDRSVLNSLQGKVAGVNISSSSGGVGSSTRIQFRGSTSLLRNNQALIVVDGIPIDNSQVDAGDNLNNQVDPGNRGNDINPEDVESVTLLKGPAAAALYGSRAANGALIITTKTGKGLKNKQAEVTVTSSYTLESILKLPDFQNEYGQGGQKAPDLRENFSWGEKFDGKLRPWGQVVGGEQRVKPYVALKDNVKEFFDIGRVLNNGVSLSQANEKNSYFLSLNNLSQKGIMEGTKYERTSVRLNGTANLSPKLYSNASINYIRSHGDLSIQGQGASPYDQILQTPRDIPILELKDYKNNKFNTLSGYYGAYTVNPYYLLAEDSYQSTLDRVLGNVEIGYKAAPWLDFMYRIGTDVSSDKRKQISSKRVIPDDNNQNAANKFAGSYSEGNINIRELTSDLIITANHKFNSDLSIRALIGHNYRQRSTDVNQTAINDLVIAGLYNLGNTSGNPVATNASTLRRLVGVYADVNIAFKNYLFLGITGRNDWSSTLPKTKNSFFYPSVNLSFVFSDALRNKPSWLSYGKLRLSAARVGNDADPYSLQSIFAGAAITDGFANSQLTFPFNGVPGFTVGNQIGNPNLTPEFTTSYEAGMEASFFTGRLGFDVTYYRNESKDQILTLPIPSSSGYTSRVTNIGSVTNRGVELLLRGTPVKSRNFSWEITGTYTKNNNRVNEIAPGTEQVTLGGFSGATLVAKRGEAYGSFFGASFLRDSIGRVVVDAATGYPVTDPQATIHGNIQPDFTASLLNVFTYKGFTLSALIDGRKGGVFFSRTRTLQLFTGTDPLTLYNDREAFVIPNSVYQDASGKYVVNTKPVANAQDYWTNYVSTNAVENLVDASFIKLREVSLSWKLPSNFLRRTPFTNIQVGLSGRNLLIKTPKENTYSDPEASSFGPGNVQGFEYGTIPSIRSYGANIRITF